MKRRFWAEWNLPPFLIDGDFPCRFSGEIETEAETAAAAEAEFKAAFSGIPQMWLHIKMRELKEKK